MPFVSIFEQEILDQQKAIRDQEQAIRDQKQTIRDQKQAIRDQEQAIRDQKQLVFDREQALLDQEQILLDQEQILLDQKQILLDQQREFRESCLRGIAVGLKLKFHADGEALFADVQRQTDSALLRRFLDRIETAASLDELRQLLP